MAYTKHVKITLIIGLLFGGDGLQARAPYLTGSELGDFQEFLRVKIKPLARESGISNETLSQAFDTIQPQDMRVIKPGKDQLKQRITSEKYADKRIPPPIRGARRKAKKYRRILDTVQSKYGVSKAFILALWGLESNFGAHMGNFDVIRSLATLAFHGRRQVLFTNELIEALKILQEGRDKIKELKGSWMGDLGQSQLISSALNTHMIDNGDKNLKDIWVNPEDVFSSIAIYLVNSGWKSDEPWGIEVTLPHDFSKKQYTNIHLEKSRAHWEKLGIKSKDPKKRLANLPGTLIIPDKKDRAFIVYNNFKVILKWNHSICFALTVCLFADQIGQEK